MTPPSHRPECLLSPTGVRNSEAGSNPRPASIFSEAKQEPRRVIGSPRIARNVFPPFHGALDA